MIKAIVFTLFILASLNSAAQQISSKSLCQNIISSYGPTKYDKPLFRAEKDLENFEARSESNENTLKIEKIKKTIKILKKLKRKKRAVDLQDCLNTL